MAMPATRAGAVVYAKDPARVAAFYEGTAGLRPTHAADDHLVLAGDALELFVVRIPPAIAASIVIETPPERRQDTPIKLVLPVSSLQAVRMAAARLGGALNAPEREWSWRGWRFCDGHDPEGNVVQFREQE
jgi:predicted enzyme related to lactoylglutathione lyase